MTGLGPEVDALLRAALLEDLPYGDLTSEACVPEALVSQARFIAREELVLSGSAAAARVFELLDPRVEVEWLCSDGELVASDTEFGRLHGPARSLLGGERTALNLLQRLCGVATHTRRFVRKIEGTGARVLDTRKTTPGWRRLEKQAVRAGGGDNHRYCLSDGLLIKSNHVGLAGSVAEAVKRGRERAGHLIRVEVEVRDLEELRQALEAGAEVLLLDNMSCEQVRACVELVAGRAVLEVSGGIDLDSVLDYARTGVDYVSVGALTHSAPASDISLRVALTRV